MISILDFGALLHQNNVHVLEDLIIRQENKPAFLLAEGEFAKDDIELHLEEFLRGDGVDFVVLDENVDDSTDRWKINVGYQGKVF